MNPLLIIFLRWTLQPVVEVMALCSFYSVGAGHE